jgi:OB-fold nucleic acid binding domain
MTLFSSVLSTVKLTSTTDTVLVPNNPRTFNQIPGFKHIFIEDILLKPMGSEVQILCWVSSKPRHHGKILFFDVGDSTGCIQVIAESSSFPDLN